MTDRAPDRRDFLKAAGAIAASTALGACEFQSHPPESGAGSNTASPDRVLGLDRTVLDAVGEAVLPSELGEKGRDAAIGAFIAWVDGYDPVAEEMHGYGYADIRYLPADPAPAWRAQLAALDTLARKTRRLAFARLPMEQRRELLQVATRIERGDRLPSPLDATHVAVALLAHWAATPDAWDMALGARVQGGNCRALADANAKPAALPVVQA